MGLGSGSKCKSLKVEVESKVFFTQSPWIRTGEKGSTCLQKNKQDVWKAFLKGCFGKLHLVCEGEYAMGERRKRLSPAKNIGKGQRKDCRLCEFWHLSKPKQLTTDS